MSDFQSFAAAHGLIIRDLEMGRWCRVPTEDHPASRNGAYKFMGDCGHVQNWATMPEASTWFPDADSRVAVDRWAMQRLREKAEREAKEAKEKAARKAGWICHQCVNEQHAYLDWKGFPDLLGMVWHKAEGENLLVVPMCVKGKLVGCQTINRDGEKKFLFGQQTKGAEYLIDNKGSHYFVEGYASGLSLRLVLKALKVRYTVHVCFSAHNLTFMAKAIGSGIVIADRDASETGERAAKATGLPYWISDVIGNDINDDHQRLGIFRLSQSFRQWLRGVK